MVLNEEQGIKELREKRIAYGISQGRLALASGITREYLNKIESGKMKPSKELLNTLQKELAKFNPEAPLTMLFDYVKIRFPTLDIQHIIKDILKLNINYMLHEDYGHYSYTEHYSLGDIFIYTSADEEKGVLLELKGRGWSYVKKKYKLNVTNFLCSERSLTCYFYCILLDVFKILFLIFIWRQISTMTVNAHGIVKCFDVFKNQFMCMCIIKDFKPVDPFSLQKCMERFYTGVIPWICFL